MKKLYLFVFILFTFIQGYSNIVISTATGGNWNAGATWVGGVAPVAADSVVIANGATVVFTFGASCANLTVGQGVSGMLQYPTGTTLTAVTVSGSITIAAGGTLRSSATNPASAVTHPLSVGGDFTNNGTFHAQASTNSRIALSFTGAANNSLITSATSSTTFYTLTLTKGVGNRLDFNPGTNFLPATGFLVLSAATGIFQVTGTTAITHPFFNTANYTINNGAGFWLNNPNATVTAQAASASFSGLLRITAGIYNQGTTAGHQFSGTIAPSTLIMEGGQLNTAGVLQLSSGGSTFVQNGGTITIAQMGNNTTSNTLTLFGNITISGGAIIIANPATTARDYYSTTTTHAITGGTLQLGNASTPAGAVFKITGNTPNTVLDNSSGNNPAVAQWGGLIVQGDITLNGSGSYSKGAFSLTMTGMSAANPGNITVNGSNALTLNGSSLLANALSFNSSFGNQSVTTGSGSITSNELPSVTVNNTFAGATVTIPAGLSLMSNSTLTLTRGTLDAGTSIQFGSNSTAGSFACIRSLGFLTATASSFGTAVNTTSYAYTAATTCSTGPELITGSSLVTIDALTINGGVHLTLSKPVTVRSNLNLTNGYIYTSNTNLLTLGTVSAGTLTAAVPSGAFVEGPFARVFGASRTATGTYNATTYYPAAISGSLIPLYIDPNTDAAGPVTITLEPVAGAMAASWTSMIYGQYTKLDHDWKITLSGTGVVTSYHIGTNVTGGSCNLPGLLKGNMYYAATNPDGSNSYTDGRAAGLKLISGSIWGTYSPVLPDAGGLPSGGQFTIATLDAAAITPGGIDNDLKLWLKADNIGAANGNPVTNWPNTIGAFAAPVQPTPANQPSFADGTSNNATNYNPSLYFNGSNNYMNFSDVTFTGNLYTMFAVANNEKHAASGGLLGNSFGSGVHAMGMDFNGTLWHVNWGVAWINSAPAATAPLDRAGIFDFVYGNSSGNAVRYNGHLADANTNTGGLNVFAPASSLGNVVGNFWQGTMAEVLMYNTASLTATARQQIQSYLALKYGITLNNSAGGTAGDYLLSNGSTAWSAASNAAYHNEVISIVRDDASGLLQKQSRNSSDSMRLYAGNLSASNQANTATIANNLSSIVVGHDGGKLHSKPGLAKPATIYSRFERTWKITNTNFTDNFSVEIEWDSTNSFFIGDLRLLVSDSPDFTSAAVYSSYDVNFYIGSIIVENINPAIIPVNSTKYFTIASVSPFTSLGVQLIQFTASPVNNEWVTLTWETATETSNDYFTVERSQDGHTWQTAATLAGAGNTSTAKKYSTVDKNPYSGISYYRLKQTDMGGKYTYSDIKKVTLEKTTGNGMVVYPNPAVNQLTVQADAAALKTLRIYNMTGQDVTSLAKTIKNNSAVAVLDITRLPAGVYTIKTNSHTATMIKQ